MMEKEEELKSLKSKWQTLIQAKSGMAHHKNEAKVKWAFAQKKRQEADEAKAALRNKFDISGPLRENYNGAK